MIAFIKVVLMGIVQGLSEFLPISSSGHLVFMSNIIKYISGNSEMTEGYDIVLSMMLHLGTLLAIILFFGKDILDVIKALINGYKTKNYEDKDAKIGINILWSTVATIIVALMMNNTAERLMERPAVVGFMLILTGCVLFLSEKYTKKFSAKEQNVTLKTAVIMGLAQGLAVLPGFSRSGWTISAGLFSGTDRVQCAKFSFIMSLPVILGASIIYPLTQININELLSYNWTNIFVGTLISAFVGYLCIKYFLKFLSKYSLNVFGYYCVIVGFIATLAFTFI